MSFLGNKEADYQVLYRLNDYDLIKTCSINRYYRNLCSNDIFWMNKVLRRFSILGDIEMLRKYKGQLSWKKYYIRLVDILEKEYAFREFYDRSEDAKKISELFRNNYAIFLDHLENYNIDLLKKDLENDFLNPNEYEEIFDLLNPDQLQEFIPLLAKSLHFKVVKFRYYDHPEFLDLIFQLNKDNKFFISDILFAILDNFPTEEAITKVLAKVSAKDLIDALIKYDVSKLPEKTVLLFLDIIFSKKETISLHVSEEHDFISPKYIEKIEDIVKLLEEIFEEFKGLIEKNDIRKDIQKVKTLEEIIEEFKMADKSDFYTHL